jgi:hypothetical protein
LSSITALGRRSTLLLVSLLRRTLWLGTRRRISLLRRSRLGHWWRRVLLLSRRRILLLSVRGRILLLLSRRRIRLLRRRSRLRLIGSLLLTRRRRRSILLLKLALLPQGRIVRLLLLLRGRGRWVLGIVVGHDGEMRVESNEMRDGAVLETESQRLVKMRVEGECHREPREVLVRCSLKERTRGKEKQAGQPKRANELALYSHTPFQSDMSHWGLRKRLPHSPAEESESIQRDGAYGSHRIILEPLIHIFGSA